MKNLKIPSVKEGGFPILLVGRLNWHNSRGRQFITYIDLKRTYLLTRQFHFSKFILEIYFHIYITTSIFIYDRKTGNNLKVHL